MTQPAMASRTPKQPSMKPAGAPVPLTPMTPPPNHLLASNQQSNAAWDSSLPEDDADMDDDSWAGEAAENGEWGPPPKRFKASSNGWPDDSWDADWGPDAPSVRHDAKSSGKGTKGKWSSSSKGAKGKFGDEEME